MEKLTSIALFLLTLSFYHQSFCQIDLRASPQKSVGVIELRDYILKPGMYDPFSKFMHEYIIPQQESLGAILIDELKLKDSVDNFVWIRGFSDMASRSKFLKDFYYSQYWKDHAAQTNSMLIDSYNVHLLKPIVITGQSIDTISGIPLNIFQKNEKIAVINYYLTSRKRDQLIELFAKEYLPLFPKVGVTGTGLWMYETALNDYARQHVYQDRNQLVTISYFDNETDYQIKMKNLDKLISAVLRKRLNEIILRTNTQILHPALAR